MKTLIVYATKYGTTEQCVEQLAKQLQGEVVLYNLKDRKVPDLASFDTLVVGGAIYAGKLNRKVQRFCKAQQVLLESKRLGLFTCNMAEGEESAKQIERNYPASCLQHALVSESFGGQFLFSRMGWITRKMIKAIAKTDQDTFNIHTEAISRFASVLNG
ncbi:MAG: flavodoxin domain-containing protein [Sphaerochaeta sp.]|jgi:menaquinone-dependent protoporphyrinogen oxidase|uniref:flavodoxin domain-containing protein n=1 Tax=Sphaerochaeta sp. TaxID=1972642 RepID=UPI002FC6EEFF